MPVHGGVQARSRRHVPLRFLLRPALLQLPVRVVKRTRPPLVLQKHALQLTHKLHGGEHTLARHHERVADRLHLVAAVLRDQRADQPVVRRHRVGHQLGARSPQRRAALDVGEHERHELRRLLRRIHVVTRVAAEAQQHHNHPRHNDNDQKRHRVRRCRPAAPSPAHAQRASRTASTGSRRGTARARQGPAHGQATTQKCASPRSSHRTQYHQLHHTPCRLRRVRTACPSR
ncbi:receptor-type adenylate cyclase [Trypanosoma rangeli SC58]|uniref:Receptor-type adenylate cyclase n=1 Tax=Trypanosoma rangeli SC58 TaxID=429131 RepID=A0A061ISM1_TRYRA|nr:receptor-type adenylate cyclase [Trypanosoma rangeli SC58]